MRSPSRNAEFDCAAEVLEETDFTVADRDEDAGVMSAENGGDRLDVTIVAIARDETGAWTLSGEAAISSDALPETIQQTVEKRIERLPEELREVLTALPDRQARGLDAHDLCASLIADGASTANAVLLIASTSSSTTVAAFSGVIGCPGPTSIDGSSSSLSSSLE